MAVGVVTKILSMTAKSKKGRGLIKKIISLIFGIIVLLIGGILSIGNSASNADENLFKSIFESHTD